MMSLSPGFHDIAPNYAGVTYGLVNFFGITSGFLAPLVAAHFTKYSVGIFFIKQGMSYKMYQILEHFCRLELFVHHHWSNLHNYSNILHHFWKWRRAEME